MVAVGRGSTKPRVLARGFETPLGLTWVGENLFVSAQGYVSRLAVRGRQVVSRRKIVTRLPFDRHQQDTIVLGPDGRLYLGSGSTCDVCKEKDARSGAILSFRQDGSDLRIVARGLRNPFGLVFDGETLYVSDNARDDLGESEPAETIVRIRPGADYGWPRCWASWRLRKLQGSCRGVTPPVAYLEPHSSANTLALWRGTLVVAEWGQYLSERWGRKLVQVNVRTGRSSTLADGFEHPLGLAVEPRRGQRPAACSPATGAAASSTGSESAERRGRARSRAVCWYAALRRSPASRRFDMKPVSTSTTGTSAQLKPVRSERSTTPRFRAPVAATSSLWRRRPARPLSP